MSFFTDPAAEPARWKQAFQFQLERFLLRGAHYRLGFIALLLGTVALIGGVAAHQLAPSEPTQGDAIWWAFLRLTDPGYLGDDQGFVRRLVSTVVTVLGYVLFMGALIAIMTQWLEATVRRLERGETPIAMSGHVLILGSASKVAVLIEELLFSEDRLRRFLSLRRSSDLRIVVMTDEVDADFRADLRSRLGPIWDEQRLFLRSGSRLRLDHLERVDFLNASAIILPAGDEVEDTERDAATIKALLSIIHHPDMEDVELPPRIVAEVKDHRLLALVKQSYRGQLDLVPGDLVVGRFLAHTLRHHGLSYVLRELLITQEGNNLVLRRFTGLEGLTFHEAAVRFDDAVMLGMMRQVDGETRPLLNPPGDTRIEPGDTCVVMAQTFNLDEPRSAPERPLPQELTRAALSQEISQERRVLVLGWNAKVHDLLVELETYAEERFHLDLVAERTVASREAELKEAGYRAERVTLRHLQADTCQPEVHRRLDPSGYDTVVFMGRGRSSDAEASDARTLLGYLALRSVIPKGQSPPPIIIELIDPDNAVLFERRAGEVLLSSVLLSHVLAQVALRPELGKVVEELFTVGGAELAFRTPASLDVEGRTVDFEELQQRCWARGEVAMGVREYDRRRGPTGGMLLNPARNLKWTLTPQDSVVVLSTY